MLLRTEREGRGRRRRSERIRSETGDGRECRVFWGEPGPGAGRTGRTGTCRVDSHRVQLESPRRRVADAIHRRPQKELPCSTPALPRPAISVEVPRYPRDTTPAPGRQLSRDGYGERHRLLKLHGSQVPPLPIEQVEYIRVQEPNGCIEIDCPLLDNFVYSAQSLTDPRRGKTPLWSWWIWWRCLVMLIFFPLRGWLARKGRARRERQGLRRSTERSSKTSVIPDDVLKEEVEAAAHTQRPLSSLVKVSHEVADHQSSTSQVSRKILRNLTLPP
ncbi:hypothetical protein B0J15DRAFT_133047 [Fusarium solani]|uniref:Uncharacterized protein n=1 Tax=Fusarium solani TaxID=169388 RepID=A0A9P9L5G8_FUSSL|nr:uncharacterized protein B0J15DRAFT_133047 [Fusarium solani]KAH7274531.1 hypothetical protein B0J15DRAFT_133047 [Fusarium solani]